MLQNFGAMNRQMKTKTKQEGSKQNQDVEWQGQK